ncbi:MAG: GMC oxidoreductase [Sulfurimicrobium sp.]|nr:GMC oxidoreductase [Sulfurimicrobium sp.]MDP2198637.1 GMC oxidoreductase [Sulfurimicrobium sp.]
MKSGMSRRAFIKAMGLGIAGGAICHSPMVLSALAAESEPVDVMIIGSGFGGAVAAWRLAEQGIHAVMLERGKRWPVTQSQDTFSTLQNPDGRSAWLSQVALLGDPKPIEKFIGVLELVLGNGVASLAGAGVGGGSLVYAGALYQPPRFLFNNAFGRSVDYHEMDSIYYPRVRSVISQHPIPQMILARPEYAAAKTWWQLGQRAGLTTKLIDMGISWDAVWEELLGARKPSVIAGEFWYGNNSGAKLSLDQNYLKYAEQSGHLDIVTQQNVTSIQEGPHGRYVVVANEIDTNGSVLAQRKYVVKKLFLATGSVGTSKLLVRAKGNNWMPALNSEVGRNWGNNGDFFSRLTDLNTRIQPNRGGTVPIVIEDHYNPISPTSVECYADWSLEGQAGTIASIGMSTPPAKGFFTYDKATDDAVLTWPGNDPQIARVLDAGADTYERIAAAGGRTKQSIRQVKSGHYATPSPVTGSVTAHPLGGAVLDLATDNIGKVKNYNNLYVIDGALVPGHTGCANPALTIAALAERNIERIIRRDFR